MLTVKTILDKVMVTLPSDKSTLRTVMLTWLNLCMQQLSIDPINWSCLHKKVLRVVAANVITLPDDFARLVYVKQADAFFLEEDDSLTDEEAFALASTVVSTSSVPTGYVVDEVNKTLTFYSGATGTVELKYVCEVPDYPDDTTVTLFPSNFLNLFFRACRTFYQEYDCDFEAASVFKFDAQVYAALLNWETAKRAVPKSDKHGYMRLR